MGNCYFCITGCVLLWMTIGILSSLRVYCKAAFKRQLTSRVLVTARGPTPAMETQTPRCSSWAKHRASFWNYFLKRPLIQLTFYYGKAIEVVAIVRWWFYYMQNLFVVCAAGIDELRLKISIFNSPPPLFSLSPPLPWPFCSLWLIWGESKRIWDQMRTLCVAFIL